VDRDSLRSRRFYGGALPSRRFYGGALPRRFYGGALPYQNDRNRWQDLALESAAKYVVSWIRLDILVNLSADSRVKFLQLICRKGAFIVLRGYNTCMYQ